MYIRSFIFFLCTVFSLILNMQKLEAQVFRRQDNSDEYYTKAKQLIDSKKYQQGLKVAEEGLAKNKNNLDLRLLLVRGYLLAGQNQQAKKYALEILDRDESYKDAYTYLVNIELAGKKYQEAERYINRAIEKFPHDKSLQIRKLAIFDEWQATQKGNYYGEELLRKYPDDRSVSQAVANHYVQNAYYYLRQGEQNIAYSQVNRAIEISPAHREAKELADQIASKDQNTTEALSRIEQQLVSQKGNYDLLLRKISLLRDQYRYAEAITVWQQLSNQQPQNASLKEIGTELKLEAATFFTRTDPYSLYESMLSNGGNNTEALQKLIGLSMARGAYREALNWVNRGLRTDARNVQLRLQKVDLLEFDRRYSEAAQLMAELYRERPQPAQLERLAELKIQSARYYLSQQQYVQAQNELQQVIQLQPANKEALEVLSGVFTTRRQYTQALKVLDELAELDQGNTEWVFRRIALLSEAGDYESAISRAREALKESPDNPELNLLLFENLVAISKSLMQNEEWELAIAPLRQAHILQPDDVDVTNYLANSYSAIKEADSAQEIVQAGLLRYPENRSLQLKEASIYMEQGRYREAAAKSLALAQRYPYTNAYRDSYKDAMLLEARRLKNEREPDSANIVYEEILTVDPKDSTSLANITNRALDQKAYDEALNLSNTGIRYYPERAYFFSRKGSALMELQQFEEASGVLDTAYRLESTEVNRKAYLFARSKAMKNQFGLYYLNTSYDYDSISYNIATIEYRHTFKKATIAARVNYAGRQNGTGLMGEFEAYLNHSRRLYSYGLVAYGNQLVFPQIRASYSLFHTFKNGLEAEIGGRYLRSDSAGSVSGLVGSLARGFGDFWFNLRGYALFEQRETNSSFNLTGRYYLNPQQDYLFVNVGLGTSPDDRSRLVIYNELSGLLTRFVGAGIRKSIDYRTSVGLNGTWITHKIADQRFLNQYDVYFSLIRNF